MTDDRHRAVRDDSDELLRALDELKRMEQVKREQDISTPRFHELADAVEAQARHVYRVASEESIDGEEAPRSDTSTNEVA
jgi:hypothetical protein